MLVRESNVSQCLERVSRSETVVLDTETNGLKTWTGDQVVGVAAAAGGERMYFPFRHGSGENLSDTRRRQLILALKGKHIQGFHLRFDLEMMGNEGMALPESFEDTLVAALLMNENEPTFALKRAKDGRPGLASKYLGPESIAADDQLGALLKDRGLTKGEMWKLDPREVEPYACDDILLPVRLLEEVYRPALERWGLSTIYRECNAYQRVLIEMETLGLPLDRTVIERALHDGEHQREALLEEIRQRAGFPLNPNSAKQVATWLGLPNAQAETVMRSKHLMAQPLIDYKTLVKRDSTYLHKFLEFADAKDVLHCQLNLTADEGGVGGTRSGRLSCSKPNLQAMPKPSTSLLYADCRRAVVAPPGFTLVELDYRQAEVRGAGHFSQEPALIEAFETSRDLYSEMAASLRISRQDAKILFLAIQYGAGVWKIAEMLGISKEQAKDLRDAWHVLYPRIKYLMHRLADRAEQNGSIRLWTDRRAHFDGATKGPGCKSPYYTAWNRCIQGGVAEMIRIAMTLGAPRLRHEHGHLLLQVHDSLLAMIETPYLARGIRVLQETMEDFPHWTIPALVDIKVGPNWLDMEPYKEAA